MKRFALLSVAALAFGLVGATPSVAGPINLVTNGTFNTPSPLNGGWGLYSNGQIDGWSTNPGNRHCRPNWSWNESIQHE